ncbi:MAG: MerR family transcriptional regulator [Deltaproteobacteria bacterium]|nr:MerR family transcriptional regulator [Deltaproteobacteria bacterium]
MNPQKPLFTIQQISRRLNIPKPTLRFWEKELEGIFVPLRSRGGQRRYTGEHIALIKKIQKLREQNKTLNEIKQVLEVSEDKHGDDTNQKRIDLLANRIAEVVKEEVYSLFRKEMSANSTKN